jgi:hypothetical protein
MSEGSHREHIHSVMLNAVFYVGISKLMAKLECSKSAAVLYALNEGLLKEGVISQEDYDLLHQRYGRKLKDVIAETQTKREPSHVPVTTIEKMKAKQRQHIDYSTLTLEQLQERYDKAQNGNDLIEIQLLSFEAKKRGAKLNREESAI